MADDNKICTCTTPEYTINLNKQGPPGVKGDTGENGFSPVIDIIQNTPSEYILNITTADGTITTPNLKGNLPTGGSTGMVLTKNSDVNGDASFTPLPSASTENPGIVQLATIDDFTPNEDGNVNNLNAVTPDVLNAELKTQVNTFIVAGDNITTSVDEEGKVTVSSTGGGELPDNITTQGNIFNGANQLVQLDSSGKLPAIDGSQLTNLPGGNQEIESIPTNSDFNNFLATGIYFWASPGNVSNNPNTNMRGYLQVFRYQDSTSFPVVQLYYTCDTNTTNSPEVWIRYCINGSSAGYTWTTWNKVNDNSIPNIVVTSDTNTNLKIWTGTQQEYDGIQSKDPNTIYAIKEV